MCAEVGVALTDYSQRSLSDCFSKFHVLSSTPSDWRTKDGLAGCARNYIPTDFELSNRSALIGTEFSKEFSEAGGEEFGEELASRPESWWGLYERDLKARDSWQGRMTRSILEGWREKGKGDGEEWFWEEGVEVEELMALPGIIEMDHVVNL